MNNIVRLKIAVYFAHSILLLRVETRCAYNKQRFRALYYTWRTLSLEVLFCTTMNNKKNNKRPDGFICLSTRMGFLIKFVCLFSSWLLRSSLVL